MKQRPTTACLSIKLAKLVAVGPLVLTAGNSGATTMRAPATGFRGAMALYPSCRTQAAGVGYRPYAP